MIASVYPPLAPGALLRRPPRVFPFDRPGLTLTHLGRGAVSLALRSLGLGPGSRIAMPAFHCGSEVEAARLLGVDVVFYRVDASLHADEEDLARVAKQTDVTYLVSYFGWPLPPVPDGVRVIEDVAHGLFSADGDVPLGSRGEAAVFCPRKSLGVPDGGAVLGTPVSRAPGRPPWRRVARSTVSLAAGRLALAGPRVVRAPAESLLRRGSRAEAAAKEGRLTEVVIGEWNISPEAMTIAAGGPSRLTAWSVYGADAHAVRAARRRNYGMLAARLPELRPLRPGVCPLLFPLRVTDRERVLAELLRYGVRAIEIWPVAHPLLGEGFGELRPLRRELIGLPVHQGLRPWHMEAVLDAVVRTLG
ncbi:DegT/DnrJ/EryC1/StrS family aminotransferase [Rhizohabitans arisaemae]|uniref:DegT/DnrJ/EryC1/StrS family aminotransferase n=1 Tax=Rhizohabitans arisaemae TaxID=2720610 RepID=UPI0024B1FBFE|nr:DegT/DnrJ/EryC1/StrS family aminotransferase [Rhizohabitans arisaemae]